MRRYVLDAEGNPVPEPDLLTWARWFETAHRSVADDTINGVRISTVFLGVDHRFCGEGPPILFETITFGAGCWDGEMRRYSSRASALAGHERLCADVRDGSAPTGEL